MLKHVILIDDNEEDSEFHEIALRDKNASEKITCLSDAEKALAFFENAIEEAANGVAFPELIFVDTLMPKIDGFELLTMMKALFAANKELIGGTRVFMLGGAYNQEIEAFLNNPDYNWFLMGYKIKPLTKAVVGEILEKYF